MTTAAPLPDTGDTTPARATPGQLLRAAREARGVHLAVLSVALKVPTRQLEALERDDYTAFKGVAFLRGLAQSVCRQLNIDPAPVLAGLPQGVSQLQALHPSPIPSPLQAAPRSLGRSHGMSSRVWLMALLMLLGSAALIWWPAPDPSVTPSSAGNAEGTALTPPAVQASEPVQALDPASVASQASTPAPPSSSGQPPVAASQAQTAPRAAAPAAATAVTPATPATAPPTASAASPATAAPAQAPLVVRPRADIWLEVRDKQAQIVIRRQLKAGEVLTQDLAAPFFVYVSKADSTEMRWNGKAVDLLASAQNNEARLQVRP